VNLPQSRVHPWSLEEPAGSLSRFPPRRLDFDRSAESAKPLGADAAIGAVVTGRAMPATRQPRGDLKGRIMRKTALLVFLAGLPAQAAEFTPQSRIDAVTVFPDGARVTRRMALDLPAGAHSILLPALPANVDANSIRIEGEGNAPLSVGAVETKSVPGEARPVVDAALEAKLRAARESREKHLAIIESLTRKKAMIERYAQASPEKLGADNSPMPVEDWAKAWNAVGQALAGVNEELRRMGQEARALEAEIRALEAARPRPPAPGRPKLDVAIALEAAAAFKGQLTVHYRIGGANWRAAYDARLATGSADTAPKLELVRRALVAQQTGEDWTEVELSVSTARTAGATGTPNMNPLQIAFYEPPPPVLQRPDDSRLRRAPATPGMAMVPPSAPSPAPLSELSADAPKPKIAAAEQVAQVETTAFEATFRVPGRISVPGDGSRKTFRIGSRNLEPKLIVRATPALDLTAYLYVEAENAEEAALLAGPVTLTRDGNFVGQAALAFAAPGEKFELGFGADQRVKVVRVPVSRRETDPPTAASIRTDTRDFRTTVENLHVRPMTVTIIDQMPFSEITTITVERLPTTTPPTEQIVAGKRGVMSWTQVLKPREKKDIRLTYRIRHPADRDIVITPQPLPAKR
jgi:uncharacterized protein (TIGR02231 family)